MVLEQDLSNVFALPLSIEAYDEMQALQSHLEGVGYDDGTADMWSPTWGTRYTSRRFLLTCLQWCGCPPGIQDAVEI